MAESLLRLYRFSGGGVKHGTVPDWMKSAPEYKSMLKASGRWFTSDVKEANWYKREYPNGRLTYVDVPKSKATQYKATNIAANKEGVDPKKFTSRPTKDYFVPKGVAKQARAVGSARPVGGGRAAAAIDSKRGGVSKSLLAKKIMPNT